MQYVDNLKRGLRTALECYKESQFTSLCVPGWDRFWWKIFLDGFLAM